jgi:hypothetical protein
MDEPRFAPEGFFDFDLTQGAVRARGGTRVLLLSDTVVGPLVSSAVQGGDLTALRRLGRHIGEEIRKSLGGSAGERGSDTVLAHAAGVLALFGWGQLSLERWGDALVARIVSLPELDDSQLALAALLGGLFTALVQNDVACVPLARPDGGDRGAFILVDPQVAETVWEWAQAGNDIASIVQQLAPGAAE